MIHATSELATDMVFVWNWSHRFWGDGLTPLVALSFCFVLMQQVRSRMTTRAKADSTQQLLLQAAHSNGSLQSKSQSKRSRKQAHPTSAHTSKVEAASPNSQGGVTSSSHPAENVTTSKRQVGNNNAFDETEAAGTESPAVIDAERLGSKHFFLSFTLSTQSIS